MNFCVANLVKFDVMGNRDATKQNDEDNKKE